MIKFVFQSAVLVRQLHFRWLGLVLATTFLALSAPAQIIPTNQLTSWTPGTWTGVQGGIPPRTNNIINVTQAPYFADNSGTNGQMDSSVTIQNAINACPSNGVVYLPAGTYSFQNTPQIHNQTLTIRGAGSLTTVNLTAGWNFITVGSGNDYQWGTPSQTNWITNPKLAGVTNLVVGTTNGFTVGMIVRMVVSNNPALPVISVNNYEELMQQKSQCTGLGPKTVYIWPPLYGNYNATTGRLSCATAQSFQVGIENISINASNSSGSYPIYFEQCNQCWISGVTIMGAADFNVYIYDSLRCEIRDCNLLNLRHTGPNGGGLLLTGSSGCLIENNVVYNAFPTIEVYGGCAGNVFGYNYVGMSDSVGEVGAAIDANHNAHNDFNLYEGNAAVNWYSDGFYGSSSQNTVFRNFFYGSETGNTANVFCIKDCRFARYDSFVGNILGATNLTYTYYTNGLTGVSFTEPSIYGFGLPSLGGGGFTGFAPLWTAGSSDTNGAGPSGFQELDTNVFNTATIVGNWNVLSGAIPANESLGANTLSQSMYLTNKPAWFNNMTWPPFDPTNPNPSKQAIPAGYRFFNNWASPVPVPVTVPPQPPLMISPPSPTPPPS